MDVVDDDLLKWKIYRENYPKILKILHLGGFFKLRHGVYLISKNAS